MAEPNIYRTTFGSGRTGILQQAVLEANRGAGSGSFRTIGNNWVSDPTKIESQLNDLKFRMGRDKITNRFHMPVEKGLMGKARAFQQGVAGEIFKRAYPEKFSKLSESIINMDDSALRQLITGASRQPGAFTGLNPASNASFNAAGKTFTEIVAKGKGNVGLSMPTRLMLNANWSATKMGARAGMGAVRGANMASKAVLGASLGQVGFAAAVVGGIGYGIGNALGITGPQAAQAATAVHETFKQASKPVYGYSEIGQSTQGLVFGLHSRRTR